MRDKKRSGNRGNDGADILLQKESGEIQVNNRFLYLTTIKHCSSNNEAKKQDHAAVNKSARCNKKELKFKSNRNGRNMQPVIASVFPGNNGRGGMKMSWIGKVKTRRLDRLKHAERERKSLRMLIITIISFFCPLAYRIVKNSQLTSLFFKIKTNLFSEEDASYPLRTIDPIPKLLEHQFPLLKRARERLIEVLEIYLG